MPGLLICGVDEAGRGPLAGPVFAACVVLRDDDAISGLADSKKLSSARREELAVQIRSRVAAWAVASASVEEIDTHNILRASLLAMRRAVEQLAVEPHQVLVDGLHCPRLRFPVRAVVRGDDTVAAISAASILAKTARDAVMLDVARDVVRIAGPDGDDPKAAIQKPEPIAIDLHHVGLQGPRIDCFQRIRFELPPVEVLTDETQVMLGTERAIPAVKVARMIEDNN